MKIKPNIYLAMLMSNKSYTSISVSQIQFSYKIKCFNQAKVATFCKDLRGFKLKEVSECSH